MSEQRTILSVIKQIESKDILLPSLQRKFVWEDYRIVKLFDSIMRDYPFGSFIFWNISDKKSLNKYKFYDFIKNYSDKNNFNEVAGTILKDSIDVVMDGQQRLTAINIGVKGSITRKEKYKTRKKEENYKTKFLYFKPYVSDDDKKEDEEWMFSFLEETEADAYNSEREPFDRYYKVADIIGKTKKDLRDYLGVGLIKNSGWQANLEKLRVRLNEEEIINIIPVRTNDIKDVLEIFVRINSGGKVLSKSQLLFSTIITNWEKGREEMDKLLNIFNSKGMFRMQIDTLISACMYVLNQPAGLKIQSLNQVSVDAVKENWNKIKEAVINTKNYLDKYNLTGENIISYNAVLPIIYYFYHYPRPSVEVEKEFFKFFIISQTFGVFGGTSSSTLDKVREKLCVKDNLGDVIENFKYEQLYGIDLSGGRIDAFRKTKKDITKLVDDNKKGSIKTNLVLMLLYPQLNVQKYNFDQDHLHPKNEFKKPFKKMDTDAKKHYEAMMNGIPNLQLLFEDNNRVDKNDAPLYDWVSAGNSFEFDPYKDLGNMDLYKFTLENFEDFYTKRRKLIIDYLINLFNITE